MQSGAFDTDCFVSAVRDVHGPVSIHGDWDAYGHVTDQGILAQIGAENSLADLKVDEVKARFVARVRSHLSAAPKDCPAIPGAAPMLRSLRATHQLGFATGGWRDVQRIKLRHAGLTHDLPLVGSDDRPARTEIMLACQQAMPDPGAPVLYVGDAEWDLRACRELGWHFIGVGARLNGKCPHWVRDFTGSGFVEMLALFAPE